MKKMVFTSTIRIKATRSDDVIFDRSLTVNADNFENIFTQLTENVHLLTNKVSLFVNDPLISEVLTSRKYDWFFNFSYSPLNENHYGYGAGHSFVFTGSDDFMDLVYSDCYMSIKDIFSTIFGNNLNSFSTDKKFSDPGSYELLQNVFSEVRFNRDLSEKEKFDYFNTQFIDFFVSVEPVYKKFISAYYYRTRSQNKNKTSLFSVMIQKIFPTKLRVV